MEMTTCKPKPSPTGAFPCVTRLVQIAAWCLFAVNALTSIDLPGLQMDEANQAAFVPGVLRSEAAGLHHYRLPDNLLPGGARYPIVGGSVYNSELSTYLGLPVFATLGFSVVTHRLFTALYGVLILWLMCRLMGRQGMPLAGAVGGLLLASDPLFMFALRSQAYLLLVTAMLFLAASFVLAKAIARDRGWWLWFGSGVLAGLACISYFVGWLLVLPTGVWMLAFRLRRRFAQVLGWGIGLLLGIAPLFYALVCIWLRAPSFLRTFGMPEFAVADQQAATMDLAVRLARPFELIHSFLSSPAALSFVGLETVWCGETKALLCYTAVAVAVVALIRQIRTMSAPTPLLAVWVAPAAVFAAGVATLVSMSYHHMVVLLPFIYGLVGVAVVQLLSASGRMRLVGWCAVIGLTAPLVVVNGVNFERSVLAVRRTGGVGYHNETVSQLPGVVRSLYAGRTILFAEWGLHLPFLFLTGGTVPYQAFVERQPAREWLDTARVQGGPILVAVWSEAREQEIMEQARVIGAVCRSVHMRDRLGTRVYALVEIEPWSDGVHRVPGGLEVLLSDDRADYRLCDAFKHARLVEGSRMTTDNPWGRTVSCQSVKGLGRSIIVTECNARVVFGPLGSVGGRVLQFGLGYHPAVRDLGVSDGVTAEVLVYDEKGVRTLFSRRVLPTESLQPCTVALPDDTGTGAEMHFVVRDPGGDSSGDWLLWVEPTILGVSQETVP